MGGMGMQFPNSRQDLFKRNSRLKTPTLNQQRLLPPAPWRQNQLEKLLNLGIPARTTPAPIKSNAPPSSAPTIIPIEE